MIKRIILLIIPFFFMFALTVMANDIDKKEFNNLKEKLNIDSNQNVLLYFHMPGSCGFCIDEIIKELYVIKDLKLENVQIVCCALGDREIEIKRFKKEHSTLGNIILNSNSIQDKLGLKSGTSIALIKKTGELIFSLTLKEASNIDFSKLVVKHCK